MCQKFLKPFGNTPQAFNTIFSKFYSFFINIEWFINSQKPKILDSKVLEYPVIFVDFCKIGHTMKKLIFSQNVSLPLLFPFFFRFYCCKQNVFVRGVDSQSFGPKDQKNFQKIFEKKCPTRKNDPVSGKFLVFFVCCFVEEIKNGQNR